MSVATAKNKARHANAFKPKPMYTKKKKSTRNSILFDKAGYGEKAEQKNVDLAETIATGIDSGWITPRLLNATSSGTGPNGQRIGRKVRNKSILFRYNVLYDNGSGSSIQGVSQVRFVCIYDKQFNGETPVNSEVFVTNSALSPLNLSNSQRFQVIFDEWSESRQSTNLNISGQRYVKMDKETCYTGSESGEASIRTGAFLLYVASLGANSGEGSPGLNVDYITRIRYTDV